MEKYKKSFTEREKEWEEAETQLYEKLEEKERQISLLQKQQYQQEELLKVVNQNNYLTNEENIQIKQYNIQLNVNKTKKIN